MDNKAKVVSASYAMTCWMADQVPLHLRGNEKDPYKIVEHAMKKMREDKKKNV